MTKIGLSLVWVLWMGFFRWVYFKVRWVVWVSAGVIQPRCCVRAGVHDSAVCDMAGGSSYL